MVCDRCISSVDDMLSALNIPFRSVKLGEVVLERPLDDREKGLLQEELLEVGFSLIDDKAQQLANKIRSLVIEEVYDPEKFTKKLPEVLVDALGYDYSYISSLFRKEEGITIENFRSKLKIERTKELLEYGEMNVNEIAAAMGYKSVSYFCAKFKKEVGSTPLAYQKDHKRTRCGINNL